MSYPLASIPGVNVSKGSGGAGPPTPGANLPGIFPITFYGASAGATAAANVTAIDTAIATANAAGGIVYIPNDPAGPYLINAPIVIPPNTTIVGEASTVGTPKSVLRASAAMPAMLQVQTQQAQTIPTAAKIGAIALDCNFLALCGVDRRSDLASIYDGVQIRNVPLDGFHSGAHTVAVVISAVTAGGGAAAGQLTLSQPDLSYAGDISSTGTNYVIKFVLAGGYGVGQFVLSQDGGITFATARQTVQAVCNLVATDVAIYTHALGLQAAFSNIIFALGWTYAFTATAPFEPNTFNTTINALAQFKDCSVYNLGVAYCSDAATSAFYGGVIPQAFDTGGTITATTGSQLLIGVGTSFLTGSQPGRQPRPGDTIWLDNSPDDLRLGNFQVLAVADDFTIVIGQNDSTNKLPNLAAVKFALIVGAGFYVADGGDNIGESWRNGYMEQVANGWRLSGVSPMSLYSPFLEADWAGIGVGIGGQMSAGGQTIVQAPYIKLSARGRQFYMQQHSYADIFDPEGPFGPDAVGGSGFARISLNGQPYGYNFAQFDFLSKSNLVLASQIIALTAPNQVLVPPPLDPFQGGATAYTILVPNADYLTTAQTPIVAAVPALPGQFWVIENQINSDHVIQFFDNATYGLTHLSLEGQSQTLFPGERLILFSSLVSGVSASWEQFGPIHRSYRGQSGEGSRCGSGSGAAVGIGTLNVQTWDIVFAPTMGFAAKVNISAKDAAGPSFACWVGCTVGVDASGAILGQFVPITNAQGAYGSNAGLPPAGWSVQFASVMIGGNAQVAAQVTTAGGITAKCLSESEQIAAFPI